MHGDWRSFSHRVVVHSWLGYRPAGALGIFFWFVRLLANNIKSKAASVHQVVLRLALSRFLQLRAVHSTLDC